MAGRALGRTSISLDAIGSGAGLVGSGLLPWTRSGPGSSFRGMELAAALRSSAGLPDWAPRAGLGIIALAVLGLVHLASAVSTTPLARRARFGTGAVVLAALVWIATRYSADRWGGGLLLAAAGAACAVVAGAVHEVTSSRGSTRRVRQRRTS